MRFEVWAPTATSVRLAIADDRFEMERGEDGYWRTERDVGDGTTYAFVLDDGPERTDPRAVRLPSGPEGRAAVHSLTAHDWTDRGWRGVSLPGSVLYEMHVGTFTPGGTLDSAVERLDHLIRLGVDAVEVMPLATFPGARGWGYDGVGLYAVHEAYGGPDAFCRFVDACHARNLAVVLDVVYNHFGPSGNYISEFGPYFTDRYATPWGQALNLDGENSDEVRRFIIDNAVMWLRDFHVDGLRLDAVHALFDDRAITVLEELATTVAALSTGLDRPLWLIAESDRNDARTVTPIEAAGLGLDAQWADDVHHALHATLTGEAQGYYSDFAVPGALSKVLQGVFLHDGTYSSFRRRTHGRPVDRLHTPGSRFVVFLQNHDQVGNRATGDRLSATLSPGLQACGAALLLTAAQTPMLFMGEEWGASTPWLYFTAHTDPHIAEAVRTGRRDEFAGHGWNRDDVPDPQAAETFERSRLDWSELEDGTHAAILAWYTALIATRHAHTDLADPRLDRIVVEHDVDARTVVVNRGAYVVAVNLGSAPATFDLPDLAGEILLAWQPAETRWADGVLHLPPESAAIVGPA